LILGDAQRDPLRTSRHQRTDPRRQAGGAARG
jgi:hypothetical protein